MALQYQFILWTIFLYIAQIDFASGNAVTFTTTQAPEKEPFLTAPLCPSVLDIVVAIDSSGSVKDVWDDIIDDAEIFLSNFIIGDTMTRVGIIDFSAVSNVYTPLDTNNNGDNSYDMLETLRKRHQNGESWLELGFDRANDLYRSANPPRPETRKVLVIYTDGEITSGDTNSLMEMIKSQRESRIEHYIVKVKNDTETNGYKILLNEHCNVFPMHEPPEVGQISLEEAVCYKKPSKPDTTTTTTPQTTISSETTLSSLTTLSPVTTITPVTKPSFCYELPEEGPCRARILRFYFNHVTDQCERFYYGGCGGSANNFGSEEECRKKCRDMPGTTTTAATTIVPPDTTPSSTLQTTPQPYARCILEREEALKLIQSKIPIIVQIFVPQCGENGTYKPVQHHEGTGYYWCVDPETGDLINETKSQQKPDCPFLPPGSGPVVPNEPFTTCEREKVGLQGNINSAYTPECSPVDGMFIEVQKDAERSFCVNRNTGIEIEGTSLKNGEIPGLSSPICPEKTKCEKEVEEINAKKYQAWKVARAEIPDMMAPECDVSGLYKAIQMNFQSRYCVNRYTGEPIEGTMTSNGNRPICPVQEMNKECTLPKSPGMCLAAFPRYYFNSETLECEKFTYGGCNGNENNFETLEKCEKKCGYLTHCRVVRMKQLEDKVTDPLKCDKGGDFKEVQQVKNGTKYCVDRYTGEKVDGKPLNDHYCEVTRVPKCLSEQRPAMPGAFIPVCDKSGNYESLQTHGSTGQQWCVHKYEGIEIPETRVNPGENITCPVAKSENCLLPKKGGSEEGLNPRFYYNWKTKKCHRFNYDGKLGNGNCFVTLQDCMIACVLETSYPEGHPLTKAPVNLLTPEYTTTTTTATPVIIENMYNNINATAVPEPEPEGIPPPFDENYRFYPQDKCGEANDFLEMRARYSYTGAGPLQYDKFDCEGNSFAPLQQNTVSNRKKWCVNPTTGHILKGTLKEPFESLHCPIDGNLQNLQSPDANKPEMKQPTEEGPHHPEPEPPYPEPEPHHPEPEGKEKEESHENSILPAQQQPPSQSDKKFYPTGKCTEENLKVGNKIGAMIYNCEQNGDYSALQTHGTTGEKWCVDVKTGAMRPETLSNRTDPTPNCDAPPSQSPSQSQTQLESPQQSQYQPQPQTQPQIPSQPQMQPQPQIQPQTLPQTQTQPQPQAPAPPQPESQPNLSQQQPTSEEFYKFNPTETCNKENEKLRESKKTEETKFQFECEANGDYKLLQRNATSGEKWCVDAKTGKLISDTYSLASDNDPDCEKAGNPKTSNDSAIPAKPDVDGPSNLPDMANQELHGASTKPLTNQPNQANGIVVPSTANQTIGASQVSPSRNSQNKDLSAVNADPLNSEGEFKIGNNFEGGENLKKLGCYRYNMIVPPGPLPVKEFEDESYEHAKTKEEKDKYMRSLIVKCAKATKKQGWFTFGLKDGKECVSGPDEGRYKEDGVATPESCVDNDDVPCNQDDTKPCVGLEKENPKTGKESNYYAYMIVTKEHKNINVIEYDRRKRNIQSKLLKRFFTKSLKEKKKRII